MIELSRPFFPFGSLAARETKPYTCHSQSPLDGENMSLATENLAKAMQTAMSTRPKVGGFPHLAETLRSAGVTHNIWTLPSCQSIYLTKFGSVVTQGTPLVTGQADVPNFDRDGLIRAIRADQAGESSFPEFLTACWQAGVIRYDVDFEGRKVSYFGAQDETYIEVYQAVAVGF